MPFGLRLSLLLLIAGCAETALVVPDSDWRTVAAAQRDAIDRRHDTELAAARAELASATASLAAFQRAPATPHAAPARAPATAADAGDVLANLAREQEQARIEALGRVNAAADDKQRSDLAWRRVRVDAADAQIDMIVAKRELTRAQAIDRNLPGNDSYDTAPLRGQFSRTQQRWYTLSRSARAARDQLERASASLASAKEAYAQLMRSAPIRLPEPTDAEDRIARFELPGWSIARSDVRRRRGLRRVLGEASPAPQLHKVAIQLSPALRARPAATLPSVASPAPPAVSPPTDNPPGDAIRGNPPMTGHPAGRAGGPSPPAALARKPDAAPRSAPPAPAPRAPAPRAIDHPADRAGNPSPTATAASAGKPAGAPRAASPAPPGIDHPADRAGQPARAIEPSPSTATLATGGKPTGSSRGAASSTTAASAKSAERPAISAQPSSAPPASKPGAPHETASGGATSAAKPVERPLSESNTRAR